VGLWTAVEADRSEKPNDGDAQETLRKQLRAQVDHRNNAILSFGIAGALGAGGVLGFVLLPSPGKADPKTSVIIRPWGTGASATVRW
jgi:hypothetical protein